MEAPGKTIPCVAAHLFTTPQQIFKLTAPGRGYDGEIMNGTVTLRLRDVVSAIVVTWLIAILAGGCQHSAGARDSGTVVSTVGQTVPSGLEPAYVVRIDGHSVFPSQRGFALAPGIHEIRVAPHIPGPTHQVPTHEAMITVLRNDALELDVREGWTYFIAMRVIETPDYTTRTGYWRAEVARAVAPGQSSR